MPVISWNALVSVLLSYSCVGIVSDSTLISRPAKGLAAAMNHSISFCCSALDSTEGWNSLSIHFFASSMPAMADGGEGGRDREAKRRRQFLCFFMCPPSSG